MELIATLPAETRLSDVAARAARAEQLGFDVLHVSETVHDPFVSAALALEHTSRLTVRTSMVVAFPRSPMVTALAAWDLAQFSGGRFQLGVASQVRGNIVGRYSSAWVDPVSQLRDYVASLRAIFRAFQTGEPLAHEGPHYRFDRLQPYFRPEPLEHAAPSIWTGGVNVAMCELGGEIADGFVCHPTASHPDHLAATLVPAIDRGVLRAGRTDGGPMLAAAARPVTGRSTADVVEARAAYRPTLAFLYSTPAYRRQLELFGLGELGEQLSTMAQQQDWSGLERHLTDDIVELLVPHGTFAELPGVLQRWYAGRCDALSLTLPEDTRDDDALAEIVRDTRLLPTRSTGFAGFAADARMDP